MTSAFLGLAVAVAGFFCIVVAALTGQYPALESYRWYVVGCFGLVSVIFGGAWFRAARAARAELQDAAPTDRSVLLRAWSAMMAILGAISIFLQPLRPFGMTKPVVVQAAAPRPKPPPPRVVETPPPPKVPVKFREFKIQGILFQHNKPLVLIGGDAYGPGEMYYDIRIKSVQRNAVTVEKDGVEKVIPYNG